MHRERAQTLCEQCEHAQQRAQALRGMAVPAMERRCTLADMTLSRCSRSTERPGDWRSAAMDRAGIAAAGSADGAASSVDAVVALSAVAESSVDAAWCVVSSSCCDCSSSTDTNSPSAARGEVERKDGFLRRRLRSLPLDAVAPTACARKCARMPRVYASVPSQTPQITTPAPHHLHQRHWQSRRRE